MKLKLKVLSIGLSLLVTFLKIYDSKSNDLDTPVQDTGAGGKLTIAQSIAGKEEPTASPELTTNRESVELMHLSYALNFSQFEISRSGNMLTISLQVKNTGKYEDMIDSADLVIKQGNGNAISPVLGYVGDYPNGQELKDWRNLLNSDSTSIYAQYNIEQNQNAQYDLYYVYMDELKWLHSFSEADIKATDKYAEKNNSFDTTISDASEQLDQFTQTMNDFFSRMPIQIQIGGWNELEYAPRSFEIKYNQITLGVHIGSDGVDTVNVLETSNEQMSNEFLEFISSTILCTNPEADPQDIFNELARNLKSDKTIRSSIFKQEELTYSLVLSNFEGLGTDTDYAYNFMITKNNP
jgi:hypothetical protein